MSEDIKRASNLEPLHKTKKKPLKVVYISNPVKVETSASHFRDLVQQLTGRDSGDIITPLSPATKILESSTVPQTRDVQQATVVDEVQKKEKVQVPTGVESGNEMGNGSDLSFQDDDSVFMPQLLMVDNFNSSFGLNPPHFLN